jgi:hypothetical protein
VAGRTFLGTMRLALLVMVLVFVALGAWLDRRRSTAWDRTLRVTVYPVSVDTTSPGCVAGVTAADFDDAANFLRRQAQTYRVALDEPVAFTVSHAAREAPPALSAAPGPLAIAYWSLRTRWWARRVAFDDPLPKPDVQVFAMYHADESRRAAPDSTGLSKGLIVVAHLFCGPDAVAGNAMVVTHELLHTLGATDKYDRATDQPLDPDGLGSPAQSPLYPQRTGEIMAGRIAVSARDALIPESLRDMVVGPATAREIGWLR